MSVKKWVSILLGLTSAALLAGCAVTLPSGDTVELPLDAWGPAVSEGAAASGMGQFADSEPEAEPPEAEPIEFSLAQLSTGAPKRAQDIFAQVSPAVAHIQTPSGSGSAVLVDHGYLVSAAHVVWPHEKVRVVFADGTEFEEMPVAGWNQMADVALLGPVDLEEIDITPLTFADGSDLPTGSEVYLIGYPAEFEEYPQPALGRGLLSRQREWESTGISMFQVDADISGGQSGGAMVSEQGDLVGITNYRFTDSNSPMVTSSADVVPALTAMLAGDPETLADRRPLAGQASSVHEDQLSNPTSYDFYLFFADAGEEIDLSVEGVGNPSMSILTVNGQELATSAPRAEKVAGVATKLFEQGPYVAAVTQLSDNRNTYVLTGDRPLYAVDDPDEETQLQVGDTYVGGLDSPYDEDIFTISLRAGERVAVQAESLAVDPLVLVRYDSEARTMNVFDDDSGPTGLSGLNARVVFVAPEEGEYTIYVANSGGPAVGGYLLSVTDAEDAERLTDTLFEEEHFLTAPGLYNRYESNNFPFTLLYPSEYESSADCGEEAAACFGAGTQLLGIFEGSASSLAPSERDADAILDAMGGYLRSSFSDLEVLSRRTITTHQGLTGTIESMSVQDGSTYLAYFVYFADDIGYFLASFGGELGADANLDLLEENIDELFASFRLVDEEKLADDASYYLEEAMHSAARRDYAAALSELDSALELNDALEQAYGLRAQLHWRMGNLDLALADMAAASAIDPSDAGWMETIAYLHWHLGENDEALAASEEVIELAPDYQGIYNGRALFRASAGDYEGALEELAEYEQMVEDGLTPNTKDTRAYVHLKFGSLQEALADYEEILADDFQPSVTLFGAGVTLARLGRMDEALPLIDYGLEKFEEDEYEIIDPQLTELLQWTEEILEAESSE